jgi:hypothetical protein
VAENIAETSYSEYIDSDQKYEWSVRTVCEEGMSKKVRTFNETCEYYCDAPIDFTIETATKCLVNLNWTFESNEYPVLFNIYKDNELFADKVSYTIYSETIEPQKQHRWCLEILINNIPYCKKCLKNDMCQGGNIPYIELNKLYEFYPNPVRNELTIKRINYINELTVVEIYNISGTHLFTSYIENEQHQISFDKFPQGVYILKIYDSEQVIVKKIVKQ